MIQQVTKPRIAPFRCASVATFVLLAACINLPNVDAEQASFEPVQADLFAVAGSLSNAWGDYDGDGDLDFAVSIKGGEIRLYQNNDGAFSSLGETVGLPTEGDEIRGLSWGD